MTAPVFAFLALRLMAATMLIKALIPGLHHSYYPLSTLSLAISVSLTIGLIVILCLTRQFAAAISGQSWSPADSKAVNTYQAYAFFILGGFCLILSLSYLPNVAAFLSAVPDSGVEREAHWVRGARTLLIPTLVFVFGLGLVFAKALLRLRGMGGVRAH